MNWREDKWIIVIVFVILSLIGLFIYHEVKYVCLRGHYETQSRFDPNLQLMVTEEVWVCDEEMLREEYNKLNKEK